MNFRNARISFKNQLDFITDNSWNRNTTVQFLFLKWMLLILSGFSVKWFLKLTTLFREIDEGLHNMEIILVLFWQLFWQKFHEINYFTFGACTLISRNFTLTSISFFNKNCVNWIQVLYSVEIEHVDFTKFYIMILF